MGQSKSKTLTEKKYQLFAERYIIDFNAAAAAIDAGYSPKRAAQQGYKLLQDERVQAAIDVAIAARKKRLRIESDTVLLKWWDIVNADPNELTQLRRFNCRYCWGENHEYQWTPKQYERACSDAQKDDKPEPDNLGGTFFDRKRAPHPDCPECSGEGIEDIYFADTTQLSPQAKLLYQGVEQTKFGLKINMVDKMKALESVARHLGMFNEQKDEDDDVPTPVSVIIEVKDGRKPESNNTSS